MSSKDKMVSGVLWSAVVNIVTAIYGFIAAPLLIRYFGKAEYGLISLATSINGYMALMDLGLNSTNVRFFSNWLAKGDTEKVKKLMQTCTALYFVIGLINALALFIIYIFASAIFNVTPDQTIILKQLLLILIIMAIINWYSSCFNQLISATENVAWLQKRTLLTKFLMIGVLFLTLSLKLSLVQFFIATQVVTLIILPLTILKIKKDTPYVSLMAKFDLPTFKQILPYSLNVFSFGIFQYSFYNLRVVILGIQGCTSDITEFNVMNGIVGLVSTVSSIFLSSLLPATSRVVANDDKKNYYRVAYQGTKLITVCLCIVGLGMLTICPDLIIVYVGDSFNNLIPWLSLWLVFVLGKHNQCISSLILAGTDVRAISRISMISSTIGLISCWLLVPKYGAGGAVIALVIYTTIQILFYWLYYWPQKMKIDSRKVIFQSFGPYALLGICLAYILRMIPHFESHWLNIFLFGGLFVLLFIIGTWILFNKEDKEFVLGIIKFKKK